jgi:hypothetical protein
MKNGTGGGMDGSVAGDGSVTPESGVSAAGSAISETVAPFFWSLSAGA